MNQLLKDLDYLSKNKIIWKVFYSWEYNEYGYNKKYNIGFNYNKAQNYTAAIITDNSAHIKNIKLIIDSIEQAIMADGITQPTFTKEVNIELENIILNLEELILKEI